MEKIDGYEDSENDWEKGEITSKETEQRRKIRYDTRKVLEERSRARSDLNVEQATTNFDGLYMEQF
ncbi:hypothetical protein Scep_007274 [Stephania cephalantha]|uniref:Uncharacterized protein n=1 Tax=Stephania cephalantha TaxID=152367 RepID=A0AAP0KC63_9MAGN